MRRQTIFVLSLVTVLATGRFAQTVEAATAWIDAADETQVKRSGEWRKTSFRYAHAAHLLTTSDGAALECRFQGKGIAIRLANNAVPAYGAPNLGSIEVRVDEGESVTIEPRQEALEVVVARGLANGEHTLRIEHHRREDGSGCRIEGLHVFDSPTGDMQFTINGEDNAFLVEARAVISQGDRIVRNTLVRNWMTGSCRMVGLPPGDSYSLTISAAGWQTVTVETIKIRKNETASLPAIYLKRDPATRNTGFRFPALNRPAIRKSGQSFVLASVPIGRRSKMSSYDVPSGRQ